MNLARDEDGSIVAMANKGGQLSFQGELQQAEGGKATGIAVPPEVIDQLAAGQRPAVQVSFNDYTYRTTIGVMGGTHWIPVSAKIREASGVAAGDTLTVALERRHLPTRGPPPVRIRRGLGPHPTRASFFDALESLQRHHVDNINDAKTDETWTTPDRQGGKPVPRRNVTPRRPGGRQSLS